MGKREEMPAVAEDEFWEVEDRRGILLLTLRYIVRPATRWRDTQYGVVDNQWVVNPTAECLVTTAKGILKRREERARLTVAKSALVGIYPPKALP